MAWRRRRGIGAGVLGAVIVAGILCWLQSRSEIRSADRAPPARADTSSPPGAPLSPSTAASTVATLPPGQSPAAWGAPSVTPATRERLKRRERWQDIGADPATLTALVAAAHAEDDEAQWALVDRVEACLKLDAVHKASAAREAADRLKGISVVQRIVSAQEKRCAAIYAGLPEEERSTTLWRDRAAVLGNGPAHLSQALDRSFGSLEARQDALAQAFESRDPDVLEMLTRRASRDPEYRARFLNDAANTRTVYVGMRLANCALGEDCSSSGSTFKWFCGTETIVCDRATDLTELYQQNMPPADFEAAQSQTRRLLHDLEGPVSDSPEAQATLRLINDSAR